MVKSRCLPVYVWQVAEIESSGGEHLKEGSLVLCFCKVWCVCVCVCVSQRTRVASSVTIHLYVCFTQGLSLTWNLENRLSWRAGQQAPEVHLSPPGLQCAILSHLSALLFVCLLLIVGSGD